MKSLNEVLIKGLFGLISRCFFYITHEIAHKTSYSSSKDVKTIPVERDEKVCVRRFST